jgi:hypothetical protein
MYNAFMRRMAAVAVGAVALTLGAQTVALADDGGDWRAAAQAEIDNYTAEHPDDFVGIDALLTKYGLPPMKVSVDGVPGELTGAEAEQIVDARKAAGSGAVASAVPTDAFTVWISVTKDLYNGRRVVGSWNFRDNYVNGSAPDDVAAIQSNLADGCFRIKSNGLSSRVSDYTGAVQNGYTYVDDAGISGSPTLGIRDRVSGFRLLVDNGYFIANFERTGKSGCSSSVQFGGQFQYEHNQDGDQGFSASASWGKFSVSYSAPCTKLRKSSNVVWV